MKKLLPIAVSLAALTAMNVSAGTLEDVQKRGVLKCGVSTGLAGFATPNDAGKWEGLDVDLCRAVAAAALGDAEKVEYVPLTSKVRFEVLKSGEIDVLSRVTTWTFTRDNSLGLNFAGVNYYDGQGFMVPKALGVTSAKELDGASICIQTGTTTELNAAEYFKLNGMTYEPVPVETSSEGRANYIAGRCDVYTTDASALAAQRSVFEDPTAHVVLPEIISKEQINELTTQDIDFIEVSKDVYQKLAYRTTTEGVIAVAKTNEFTKTDVKFLEHYCLDKAIKAGRYVLENGTGSLEPSVSESRKYDLLDNFDTIKVLLATLGYPLFEDKRGDKSQQRKVFF